MKNLQTWLKQLEKRKRKENRRAIEVRAKCYAFHGIFCRQRNKQTSYGSVKQSKTVTWIAAKHFMKVWQEKASPNSKRKIRSDKQHSN